MQLIEIDNLVEALRVLPGVGEKTAKRYAFALIEANDTQISEMIKGLEGISKLERCSVCNGYSKEAICPICQDESRSKARVVVVASPKEILKIEEILPNTYRYFSLGGIIDPLNGVASSDIAIEGLEQYIVNNGVKEITLILPVTNEGEITASYIKRHFKDSNLKFNKIAQGVPVGSSLEYLDEITLIKSIQSAVEY